MNIEIVDLRQVPEYLPLLAAWHHQQWRDINPGQTLQQRVDKMQAYLGDELVPSTFVAVDQDELLGSAAIVEYDLRIEGCKPWLASVYVHPDYRGQGVGSKLVTHAMSHAREEGVEYLYLFTPDQASFYQRLGWEVMSKRPYHGKRVTIMKIRLNGESV